MTKPSSIVRQLTLGQLREIAQEVNSRHKVIINLSNQVAAAMKAAPQDVDEKHKHLQKISTTARREARSALIREKVGEVYRPAREVAGINVKELSSIKSILTEHGASLSSPRAALDIATLSEAGVAQMRSTYSASLHGLGPQAIRNLAGHALTEQNGVLLAAIMSHVETQKPSARALSPKELLLEMGPDIPVDEGGFPIFDNYREFQRVTTQLEDALTIGLRLLKGPAQQDPLGKIAKGLEFSGGATAERREGQEGNKNAN